MSSPKVRSTSRRITIPGTINSGFWTYRFGYRTQRNTVGTTRAEGDVSAVLLVPAKPLDGAPLDRDIAHEKATAAQYRDAWKRGGGSAWTTPAVDPELGLIYAGIGNPSPQMDDLTRPGDNLYTSSTVAIDVNQLYPGGSPIRVRRGV